MQLSRKFLASFAVLANMASARPSLVADGGSGPLSKRDFNSDNWCGMVKNASVTSVEATWTVPTVSATY